MINAFQFIAQAAEASKPAPGGFLGNPIIFPLVMIIIFYVLLIRPQQKQRKELAQKVASLQSGDKVITAGGIHGTINKVRDTSVSLRISDGVMIDVEKSSITTIVSKKSSES